MLLGLVASRAFELYGLVARWCSFSSPPSAGRSVTRLGRDERDEDSFV